MINHILANPVPCFQQDIVSSPSLDKVSSVNKLKFGDPRMVPKCTATYSNGGLMERCFLKLPFRGVGCMGSRLQAKAVAIFTVQVEKMGKQPLQCYYYYGIISDACTFADAFLLILFTSLANSLSLMSEKLGTP